MSDYILIKNASDFQKYLNNLSESKQKVIALDTEANNHKHAYGQQLCLIQIYDGIRNIIVDPLKMRSNTLKNLFENRDILKIMYDSPNDISLLVNSRNITIKSILDLRPGVELLNYEKQDLHSVIHAELGILLKDKKKFQKQNWLHRPLSEEALEYALNDVRYLIKLKDIILSKIYQKQLLDTFILRNIRIQNRDYYHDPKDNYQRVKGYKALDDRYKPQFQLLYAVREKYAKSLNMPSANIISNDLLINITSGIQTTDDIKFPKRLSENTKNKITRDLQEVIESKVYLKSPIIIT